MQPLNSKKSQIVTMHRINQGRQWPNNNGGYNMWVYNTLIADLPLDQSVWHGNDNNYLYTFCVGLRYLMSEHIKGRNVLGQMI